MDVATPLPIRRRPRQHRLRRDRQRRRCNLPTSILQLQPSDRSAATMLYDALWRNAGGLTLEGLKAHLNASFVDENELERLLGELESLGLASQDRDRFYNPLQRV